MFTLRLLGVAPKDKKRRKIGLAGTPQQFREAQSMTGSRVVSPQRAGAADRAEGPERHHRHRGVGDGRAERGPAFNCKIKVNNCTDFVYEVTTAGDAKTPTQKAPADSSAVLLSEITSKDMAHRQKDRKTLPTHL